MEILFGWIAIAGVTAMVASSKGRSGFGWFILGLLLSLLALVLVALLPSLKALPVEEVRASRYPPGTMVKDCPDCGEEVLATANVCRYCGYRPAEATPQ